MSPKRLAKQEIDVAPQPIQLGGDSHRGRTDGGAALDGRVKEEERSDAGSSSDVSSPSVIEKIIQRQNKLLRKRRRNFLTAVGMHRRTTNPSLHEHEARRRRRRHNEGKATHPELKAAQQLLDLSYTASASENNSETSHVTDASSAMETRELELNAARQMMRLGEKYSDNLKNEESESSSSSEEEECKSNLSSIARKRAFEEECEVCCGRRKRKFRSLVDIYRKTKAL